jgi:stage III sporulation protein AE
MDEHLDFRAIDSAIDSTDTLAPTSFRDLASRAVNGELDLPFEGILSAAWRLLFQELYANAGLMRNLIILGILCAVLKTLTDAYKDKEVGELAFYAVYIVIVIVLVTSFGVVTDIVNGLVDMLSTLMSAAIPLMISLLVMSGNAAGAYALNPLMIFTANLITAFVKNILTPVIIMGAAIQLINYIVERDVLSRLTELLKSAVSWGIKGIALLYAAVISLQRISLPLVNNLAVRTGKAAMKAVPVVGGILDGTLDTVLYWTSSVKSGVLAALIAVVALACAVPVVKAVAVILAYKLTAALIQPVSDPRVVKCIDSVGAYSSLLLQAGLIVVAMFVYTIVILLSF